MEGLIFALLMIFCVCGAAMIIEGCIFELLKEACIGFVITLISGFLIFYPLYKLQSVPYIKDENPYVTHQIIALKDSNEIQGKVRLRSGYINEEYMYMYGYKTYDGGMKVQKVNEDICTVYFTDNEEPHADWYKAYAKFWYFDSEKYMCEIYVPNGSLESDIIIDLE